MTTSYEIYGILAKFILSIASIIFAPVLVPKKQKSKKHGAGQFVSQFKKRVMIKQDSQDSFNLSSLTLGGGKLFGQPLTNVTENDVPPKPILVRKIDLNA